MTRIAWGAALLVVLSLSIVSRLLVVREDPSDLPAADRLAQAAEELLASRVVRHETDRFSVVVGTFRDEFKRTRGEIVILYWDKNTNENVHSSYEFSVLDVASGEQLIDRRRLNEGTPLAIVKGLLQRDLKATVLPFREEMLTADKIVLRIGVVRSAKELETIQLEDSEELVRLALPATNFFSQNVRD